jgi:Carbohydrate esterase, sialic acid-specific acetylesterase
VRVSKVTRSAEWVKLQFENQKRLQTLVGPVVQPGSTFAVSPASATIAEGKSATFSAQAGGAQKVYWVVKSGGTETVAAVDRFTFAFDAGRVTGDKAITLQCRAIYPDGVKTKDIAIAVKETIPDPVFTLTAPKTWDGRTSIELRPNVTNYRVMNEKRPAALKTTWAISGGAVIKKILPGSRTITTSPFEDVVTEPSALVLERSQFSGPLTVTATISNGGELVSRSVNIAVTEPASDPWVTRVPGKDEKPEDGQFYARDDKGEGTLHYNGTLDTAADSVFLRLYADDKLVHTATAKPDTEKSYALSVKLKPGLIKYKVEFGTGKDTVVHTVSDIVCGDAYIIDGQSNALATDTGEKSPPETNEWIRSYARPSQNPKDNTGNGWVLPVWKAQKGEKAELGWWGMELAKRLVESQKVPVFFINAAVGGTRIDQHQRSAENPTDLTTIYGRMLWRVQQAKLTHGIRAILWHQGENDQGADGPTGGFGWETYHPFFIEMAAGWKIDFPNVQDYYVYQIWPNACAMGGRHGSGDRLREKQRTLPTLFSRMSILSTLGVRPPGGCHFPLEGWAEFARMVQPLIERDHYGKKSPAPLTAPNLRTAKLATSDSIVLEFDQPVVWDDKLAGQFYLDGEKDKVASGSVSGNVLTLKLKEASAAKQITYLKEVTWNQDTLLNGANGLAALTFCEVPLQSAERRP